MINMKDISQRAGVSRYTVSKVLNNAPGVSEKTRNKILKACDELGYVRNEHAVQLVKGSSETIGIIVSQITDPFFGEIIRAAERKALEMGFQLVYRCSYEDPEYEATILQHYMSLNIKGIIIAPVVSTTNKELLNRFSKHGTVVYIDRYFTTRCHYIVSDNINSSQAITKHLISQGTSPAYLASAHDMVNKSIADRQNGYIDTMKEQQLNPVIIKPETSPEDDIDDEYFGYHTIQDYLEKSKLPNALYCATDTLALGAMRAIAENGYTIGKDIIIAGHDNLSFSAYLNPSLTTVDQPKIQIGEAAVETVITLMQSRKKNDFIHKILKSELVIRESSMFLSEQPKTER